MPGMWGRYRVTDVGIVNLRSMELWPDRIRLHIGGGITALSDPRKEWEETELKSRTLLDIVQYSDK